MIEEIENNEYYDKVTKLLLSCKFQPQMLGFDYIRCAILYYLENKDRICGITTEVYPYLACAFNTKEINIERSIRKIIDKAYEAGGLLSINEYYDAIVYTNKFKFTNSEMIAVLVEIIKLDQLKEHFCDSKLEKKDII